MIPPQGEVVPARSIPPGWGSTEILSQILLGVERLEACVWRIASVAEGWCGRILDAG